MWKVSRYYSCRTVVIMIDQCRSEVGLQVIVCVEEDLCSS